jgi:hypothetical protein
MQLLGMLMRETRVWLLLARRTTSLPWVASGAGSVYDLVRGVLGADNSTRC